MAQLRKLAYDRPVRSVYARKADLIADLRELDRRRAAGEPEDPVAHAYWRLQKHVEETDRRKREEDSRRILDLLGNWSEPEYRRGVHAAVDALNGASEPSDEEWQRYFEELETLVGPLLGGGWELWEHLQEGYHEPGHGPSVMAHLLRSGTVLSVTYDVWAHQIRFSSNEFPEGVGEPPFEFVELLDDTVAVDIGQGAEEAQREVAERLGALGLLDPLRVKASEDSTVSAFDLVSMAYLRWIFEPAASYSGLSVEELGARLDAEEGMSTYHQFVCCFVGRDVLPDCVPSAAALGIASWCWRNDTAVEEWHLPDDVLMARVNIAVTKAILPHLDEVEGTDWEAIEGRLTDSEWALPDGRKISELFGEGWPEVRRTVSERLRFWKRMDEDLLGPEPTLRLLSVGGATSYTRHWWGQGRWGAICERIVRDAVSEGIPLPGDYQEAGVQALLRDLADPDRLDDETLRWLIDMPGAEVDQTAGLRHHTDATRALPKEFTSHVLTEMEQSLGE
ncbi:hypothetical protein AB0I72_24740 [Nocardiopsis sp. NPDC049922]|uniref:hypothetical protein n=1 Tax=Nocardiopsis sp. NPDC049922 TaxID=3155157 RepID=UPI0033DE091B